MRTVEVYSTPAELSEDWVGLASFVIVKRSVKTKKKKTKEIAYFISSLPSTTPASIFQKGIRHHWKIENTLHYVKDVTFGEDASRIRTGQAPENMSLIRNIVLNLFHVDGATNIAQAIRMVAHDPLKMWKMITA